MESFQVAGILSFPYLHVGKIAGMILLTQTQIEQDIMHNKVGNQIDHAMVYSKEHVHGKRYRLITKALLMYSHFCTLSLIVIFFISPL